MLNCINRFNEILKKESEVDTEINNYKKEKFGLESDAPKMIFIASILIFFWGIPELFNSIIQEMTVVQIIGLFVCSIFAFICVQIFFAKILSKFIKKYEEKIKVKKLEKKEILKEKKNLLCSVNKNELMEYFESDYEIMLEAEKELFYSFLDALRNRQKENEKIIRKIELIPELKKTEIINN